MTYAEEGSVGNWADHCVLVLSLHWRSFTLILEFLCAGDTSYITFLALCVGALQIDEKDMVLDVCLMQCMACNVNQLMFGRLDSSMIYLWFPLVKNS